MNHPPNLVRFLAAGAVLSGCAGGQSGTDSSDSSCSSPSLVAADPSTAVLQSQLVGVHTLEGTWANGEQGSKLRIEVDLGARLPVADELACGRLPYQVAARLTTSDGVLDARASVLEFEFSEAELVVPIPELADPYRNPAAGSFGPSGWNTPTPVPTLHVGFGLLNGDGALQIGADLVNEQLDRVGVWSSSFLDVPPRAIPEYVVPPQFVAACAKLKPYTGAITEYTAFTDAEEVSSSLVGTWIRCSGPDQPFSAGLQVSSDGTWQQLALDADRLVTHGGFQSEGTVSILDVAFNNRPGSFQVDLVGPRIWMSAQLWGDQLQVDRWQLRGPDITSVYVRSDLVADSVASSYAARDRAGAAACSAAEAGTLDLTPGAELDSALEGDWTLCSGELPQGQTLLRFDGTGSVSFFDAQGTALGTHRYTVVLLETMPVAVPRAMALVLDDNTDFDIAISERPLKLWMQSDTDQHGILTAVLSALP